MALPKIEPALADLTQDIAGPLPLGLLQEWANGRQDVEAASTLLNGFLIEGIVVASDTSGLSKLSEHRNLLEVLSIISVPKGIVHAIGVEVGGKPIGTWVADNTEMFYADAVAAETVLAAAAETQARITGTCAVGIGMCLHHGRFYEIGGGLYGRDADIVESLAESFARGGEILVTGAIAGQLDPARLRDCTARADARAHAGCDVFAVAPGSGLPDLAAANTAYPHPYPPEFFALLTALTDAGRATDARTAIYDRYLRECAVVFLAMVPDPSDGSLTALLDDLVTKALMDTVIRRTVGADAHIASVGGGLGILTFDTAQEALDFALTIRARFAENAIPVKTGIDTGPVLHFANTHGRSGISGDPVNIASKISEDGGAAGRINITSRAAAGLSNLPPGSNPFEVRASGLTLTGVFV